MLCSLADVVYKPVNSGAVNVVAQVADFNNSPGPYSTIVFKGGSLKVCDITRYFLVTFLGGLSGDA